MMRATVSALAMAAASLLAAVVQEMPVVVEPAALLKRDDLIGKLVSVDDRIRFFQNHPRLGYDELYLRRTPIAVRLPEPLRPASPPREPAVIVRGRLTREGSRLYLDAAAIDLQPSDLERLDKAVSALSPRDYEQRREWAHWAAGRSKEFGDEALGARAKALEAEALRIEADGRRSTVDAPREWLALARQGRKQKVVEPAPSALAHRAFRALLAATKTTAELDALAVEVAEFFPAASSAAVPQDARSEAVLAQYEQDPAAAYRAATPEMRRFLDRRLWGDVIQRSLESKVAGDVQSALKAVDEARRMLPDRPEVSTGLIGRARLRAQENLASMRLADVRAVGELLRERAADPGAAIELYRDWLKNRRDHLSQDDAEGPVSLAGHYETLLNDAEASRQLLEQAWKAAPGSDVVAEAFKIRGYRREGEDWVKDAPSPVSEAASATDEGQGLRGKTPAEVRAALGVGPNSRSVIATNGRTMLQWIFDGPRQRRYVNFVHLPGGLSPRVVSDFFLPR